MITIKISQERPQQMCVPKLLKNYFTKSMKPPRVTFLNSKICNVFFKEFSSVHQACIYLIQNTAKIVKFYYFK